MQKLYHKKYSNYLTRIKKASKKMHFAEKFENSKHDQAKHDQAKHDQAKHDQVKHDQAKHDQAKHDQAKHDQAKIWQTIRKILSIAKTDKTRQAPNSLKINQEVIDNPQKIVNEMNTYFCNIRGSKYFATKIA